MWSPHESCGLAARIWSERGLGKFGLQPVAVRSYVNSTKAVWLGG